MKIRQQEQGKDQLIPGREKHGRLQKNLGHYTPQLITGAEAYAYEAMLETTSTEKLREFL